MMSRALFNFENILFLSIIELYNRKLVFLKSGFYNSSVVERVIFWCFGLIWSSVKAENDNLVNNSKLKIRSQ